MEAVPAFLLNALRFQDPRTDALRNVKDSEWKAILSSWRVVRLMLPLKRLRGKELPEWVCAQVDTHLADNARRFERIKQTYSAAAQTIRAAGAEHVVLKGFSLWPGYVEHPRFRPQSDIDLYCPPDSIERARDALISLGYEMSQRGHHLHKDHLPIMAPKSDWTWRGNHFDPDIPISFELHFCWWGEFTRIRPQGLEAFWSRRIERQLDGIAFPALQPVDNLGYTALNLVRDLLLGSVAPEQAYCLARFLHCSADDQPFWQIWRSLHSDSLRRLQAVSFLLAANLFACRLSEEAREEIDRLPAGARIWFRHFPKSVLSPPFHRRKDSVWLHLNLLDSLSDKCVLLLRRLTAFPSRRPTFQTVLPDRPSRDASSNMKGPAGLLSFSRKSLQYTGWIASRVVRHLSVLPVVLSRGAGYWLSSKNLTGQFWTFFAASFCFSFGMSMFFFLYNLFLLDQGYKEDFLGLMTGAMNVGSIACTIPAGILVHRFGLRRALLLCLVLVSGVSIIRTVITPRSALLCFAFLGGFATTIWAVAISPAIARLTDQRSRPYAFSVVFSTGIGVGIVANLVASRMPGWFAQISPAFSNAQAKQLALLVACAIVAVGLIPLSRVRFASLPPSEKKLYPRNPFIWRFLLALAVWSLVTGSLSPLSNVYFSQYLRTPLESMGIIFSLSQLLQVFGVLVTPFLFRKLGLVSGIASTQLAAAVLLGLLAATSGPLSAAIIYVGYTGFLWMSEPGLFTLLMDRVAPGEQAGASSLNFLVISVSQAIAVAMTGSAFLHIGYPLSLASIAAIAAISAASFWLLLGRGFSTAGKPQTAILNS
jgi:hypothetical protein